MIFDYIPAYIVIEVFRLLSQLLWYEKFGFDPRANELLRRHAVVFYKSSTPQARIMIVPSRQTAEWLLTKLLPTLWVGSPAKVDSGTGAIADKDTV